MTVEVRLATAALDPAEELRAFTAAGVAGGAGSGEAGAVVSFTGLARGTSKAGRPITALVLESYRSVTLRSMEEIAAAAMARFALTRAVVIHRTGRILPDEAIVFVAAASPHRRAAFEAADHIMDRLKAEAVFWKREEGPAGSEWIEPTEGDRRDLDRWKTG